VETEKLIAEVERLTALSIRQSSNLANAMWEKNQAVTAAYEAKKQGQNASYYRDQVTGLQLQVESLEAKLQKAKDAFKVLSSL
jgi:hypothetical protein